jgi:hypothetical protein
MLQAWDSWFLSALTFGLKDLAMRVNDAEHIIAEEKQQELRTRMKSEHDLTNPFLGGTPSDTSRTDFFSLEQTAMRLLRLEHQIKLQSGVTARDVMETATQYLVQVVAALEQFSMAQEQHQQRVDGAADDRHRYVEEELQSPLLVGSMRSVCTQLGLSDRNHSDDSIRKAMSQRLQAIHECLSETGMMDFAETVFAKLSNVTQKQDEIIQEDLV